LDGPHSEAKTTNIYEVFYKNVGHFENLVVMRMESLLASRFFKPYSIDMVFIDGCHEMDSVVIDIMSWMPVCRKLLCGHDADQDGVPKALKALKLNYVKTGTIWEVVL
jgi:hypothetical protein